jgi:hypothetical protein
MEGVDSEFWNQFAGSGTANIVTVLGFGLLWGVKKICERDTRCKSHLHCCCLDVDVRDKTIRKGPGSTDELPPGTV